MATDSIVARSERHDNEYVASDDETRRYALVPQQVQATTAGPGFVLLLALAALLFLMPTNLVLAGPLKSNGSPAVLLALLATALIAIAVVRGRSGMGLRNAGAIFLVLAASLHLVTWAVGQTDALNSVVQASTTRALVALVTSTGVGLLPMLVAPTAWHRSTVRVVLAIGMLYSSLAGVAQATTSFDPRYLLRLPGFVVNGDFVATDRDGFVRSLGTAGHPIEFSLTCGCLLALALTLVGRGHRLTVRALGLVCLLVAPIALLDSLSRTGALAFVVVGVVFVLALPIEAMAVGVLGAVLVAWFAYIIEPVKFENVVNLFLNAASDSSITSRTDDYAYVAQRFDARPWLGYGLGTQVPTQTRYLDNQWLQAALQGGVVGIVATAMQFGGALSACWRRITWVDRWERTGYLAIIAAIFISSFTFDLYSFNQARLLLFLVAGLAWSAVREAQALNRLVVEAPVPPSVTAAGATGEPRDPSEDAEGTATGEQEPDPVPAKRGDDEHGDPVGDVTGTAGPGRSRLRRARHRRVDELGAQPADRDADQR